MSIQYNYSIEERELLRQIQELKNLLTTEMENRANLDNEIRLLETKFLRLCEIFPELERITSESISPLSDMIVSLVAKYHRSTNTPFMPFPILYDTIRRSSLYSDRPEPMHDNDVSTAIHTALDSLQYKGILYTIDRGNDRKIQLADNLRHRIGI